MKRIAKVLWNDPVVCLGVVTGSCAALAAVGLIPGWAPVVELGVATPLTRRVTKPARPRR
jgi:hypothetical protein